MTQNLQPAPVAPPLASSPERRNVPAAEPVKIGHIVSVSGSQAIAVLERRVGGILQQRDARIQIGALVKITTPSTSVVGLISAVSSPTPGLDIGSDEVGLVELNLAGELVVDPATRRPAFRRGVTSLPSLGDPVMFADRHDLTRVYAQPNVASIRVGSLYQDAAVPARLLVNDLLSKHFIVVGTTGCGKSTALTCVLQRVLNEHQYAHILVLDVHNEYPNAFGDQAETIDPSNLNLPIWLLNFQELTEALTSKDASRDAESEILSDGVVYAKRRFLDNSTVRSTSLARRTSESSSVTVDTPTPYRLSDVVAFVDDQLGKLDRARSTVPYRRLKARIETLVSDQRYGFMFGSLTVQDTMTETLGRLFRVPHDGKPITVINLSSVPAEILDVVISVIARLAFDLAVWSKGGLPMLLVCEEAHRYAPAGDLDKFAPTRQALSRIAKEGRKYGVSLALVTQRPSELDPTVLSQCSTAIAMRLSTEKDQAVMRANTHDGALDLLDFLPLLGDREAIVFGQGVSMPMRIRFDDMGDEAKPQTHSLGFSESWKTPNMDLQQLEAIVARWRHTGRERS